MGSDVTPVGAAGACHRLSAVRSSITSNAFDRRPDSTSDLVIPRTFNMGIIHAESKAREASDPLAPIQCGRGTPPTWYIILYTTIGGKEP